MKKYEPDIAYVMAQFPTFNYFDDTGGLESNAPAIKYTFIQEKIDGTVIGVTQRLNLVGYPEPTTENGLPYLELKDYITFKVASNFQFAYEMGDSTKLFDTISLKASEYEKAFLDQLEDLTSTTYAGASVGMDDVILAP